jgi:hypothetical protein
MNTRVFRIDLVTATDVATLISTKCDAQLAEGFKLVSTFVWQTQLVLIFQKV